MIDVWRNGQDTVSGSEARAVATIDGRVENLFYAKEVEASIEFDKQEVKFLGSRATHHKITGYSGSGSMTINYMTSVYRSVASRYAKAGQIPTISLLLENNDESSTVGKQTIVLKHVSLDGVDLFRLNVDDVLEEDISFTFEDFEILDEFGQPIAR